MIASDPAPGFAVYFFMTLQDEVDSRCTPEYYRGQAEKCRSAAEGPGVNETVRKTYLELAAEWEGLARDAEQR